MAFDESVFPITEGFGSVGGPGFNTTVVRTDAGVDEATSKWQAPLNQWDLTTGLRSESVMYTAYSWFNAHRGAANGFRFLDLLDHASTADGKTLSDSPAGAADPADTDQLLGTGDGSTKTFQLVKNYGTGSFITTRPIAKVQSGTVLCSVNEVSEAAFTVDNNTGIVSFTTAPASGLAVKAGYEFHAAVRFGEEVDKLLGITFEAFASGNIQSLPLVELRNPVAYDNRHSFNGATNWGNITVDTTTNLGFGGFQSFNPQSTGLKIKIPPESDMPAEGQGFFVFENAHATNTIVISEADGTALTGNSVIAGVSFGEVVLGLDTGGVRIWKLIL